MSAFVLKIQDLDELGRQWEFPIPRTWVATALQGTELKPGAESGSLRVLAQRNGHDILVQGTVDATMTAECARCLEDVPLELGFDLAVLLSPEHTRPEGADEVEVRPDDVNRDYYGGTEVILDAIVRELLLLEVPMKPLCSEECKGISVPAGLLPPEEVFGRSAVDARLAPLLKLKEELSNSEE